MQETYKLVVSKIKKLTANSVRISFEVPQNLWGTFQYKAGQYLTIIHTLNGQELRRSYSLCSAPHSEKWEIGVKKMENGTFSVFANEKLKEGDVLEVLPPEGHFILSPQETNQHNYFAFAAGSGITPVMAMIQTVLEKEPLSSFVLAFGNQSIEEAMFYETLESLKSTFPDRFKIAYFFSRQSVDGCFFGRIERSMVNYLLKNQFKGMDFHSYLLCGPEEMINEVKDTLLDRGVEKEAIHFELFHTTTEGSLSEVHEGETQVTIILDEQTYTFPMLQTQSVLEAAMEKDLDPPYSCQGGICSSCIARLKDGKVEMKKNLILTDGELEDGLILTCQSHPTTKSITVDYDSV